MALILPLNNSGSERRPSPKIKYKEKVIMKNTKETLMGKTKAELNIELALLGIELTASKLKNSTKEMMVQMIMDAETQKSVDQLNTEMEKRIGENETWTCPICKTETTDFPAVSRRDNKTEICSQCGTNEAIEDFKNKGESNHQKEPTSIDEMFEQEKITSDDVKSGNETPKAKNTKQPKVEHDTLYKKMKTALNENEVSLFDGRNNKWGGLLASTHVTGMHWAILVTQKGFRFELVKMDDQKGINEIFLAMNKQAQKKCSTQVPTGSSKRYKIYISLDGFAIDAHAQAFTKFYGWINSAIKKQYPITETKTA